MTTPISRRTILAAAMAIPTVQPLISVASAAGDRIRVERISLDSAAGSRPQAARPDAALRRSTGPLQTAPFHLAALTWTGPTQVLAAVRTLGRNGWSDRMILHADHHGAEPHTAEAATSRHGTIAAVTPDSIGIDVRVVATPQMPADLTIELIDPGADGQVAPGPLPLGNGRPTIRTRADWNADESVRESGDPDYGEVRGAFVHHTAGANGYGKDDVPKIIRGIYAYHVIGRGWRDIGYNFVIDKFGRIWEGRYGGIRRPVIGAHTYGYNRYAFGASVLGTFTNNEPTPETLRAFARLIAWKFQVHHVDPTKVSYPGLKDVPAISGHRDGAATECPGDELYDRLSFIRGRVANRLDD